MAPPASISVATSLNDHKMSVAAALIRAERALSPFQDIPFPVAGVTFSQAEAVRAGVEERASRAQGAAQLKLQGSRSRRAVNRPRLGLLGEP